jgi:alpha-galactosidase
MNAQFRLYKILLFKLRWSAVIFILDNITPCFCDEKLPKKNHPPPKQNACDYYRRTNQFYLMKFKLMFQLACAFFFAIGAFPVSAQDTNSAAAQKQEAVIQREPGVIRTPATAPTPRINGAEIFGVRPGHPFFYHIPATGDRPMEFSASDLPDGLALDSHTGTITGTLSKAGEYQVTLHAKNALGVGDKKFKIVVGETIALTPAMGWNSWNHYASRITQQIVLENAKAMVDSGLINHGWSYINIDDTWQGPRGGRFFGLQGDNKFPDIKGLCDQIHAMGLKFGIYSTPWETSYAWHAGGSSETPDGAFKAVQSSKKIGQYHFATNDANQWAAWGVDYLKYDWYPIQLPETEEMYDALRHSGRDILFSLSNSMNITNGPTIGKVANSWRTTGDIKANWKSMSQRGFGQDKWRPYSSPGHWNDPDMLEIATAEHGQPGLTPDEEYTHMTLWCLLSVPLLLANDLSHMDAFTLNLLENDEVIAVNQDTLGDQAVTVSHDGDARVYAKKMADGSKAVGMFNTGTNDIITVTVKWSDLQIEGNQTVRDLWRQKDLGNFNAEFSMPVASHSGELVKIGK